MHKPGLDRTRVGISGIAGLHVLKMTLTGTQKVLVYIDCFN